MPQAVWLISQKLIFLQFWRLKSEFREPAWSGSGKISLSGLGRANFLLSSYAAERALSLSSASYKATNPVLTAPAPNAITPGTRALT